MISLGAEARAAWRRWRRTPGLLSIATIVLALGLTATSLLLLAVDSFLIQPSPGVSAPAQLRWVATTNIGRPSPSRLSYPEYLTLAELGGPPAAEVAAFATLDVNLVAPGGARRVSAHVVTGPYFEVVGVVPAGRGFAPAEGIPGAARRVAMISRRLAGELGVTSLSSPARLEVNGTPFELVGIVEDPYHGLEAGRSIDLWIPIGDLDAVAATSARSLRRWDQAVLQALVRGRSARAVRAWVDSVSPLFAKAAAADVGEEQRVALVSAPFRGAVPPESVAAAGLLALLGATGALGLLVLTCLCVAGLLVTVESHFLPDLAIRSALGAPAGVLLRSAGSTAALMSLAGTALGVGAAHLLARRFLAGRPELGAVALDGGSHTLVVAMLLLAGTTLLACLAPVRYVLRAASLTRLIGAQATATAPRQRRSFQRRLLAAQVAVALGGMATVLGLGASAYRLVHSPLGFDPKGVTGASYEPHGVLDSTVLRVARETPGVLSAALCSTAPLSGRVILTRVVAPGPPGGPAHSEDVGVNSVTPAFFDVLGIPVLAGRPLGAADTAGGEAVAVINEAALAKLFPESGPSEAIGRRFTTDDSAAVRVVGVVADAVYDEPGEPPLPTLFRPLTQWSVLPERTLLVRGGAGGPETGSDLAARIGREIPHLPLFGSFQLEASVRRRLDRLEAAGWILGVLSILGVLIAALTVGATVAFEVGSRRREFGIRQALGADRRRLGRELADGLLRHLAIAVPFGAVLGLGGALATGAAGFGVRVGESAAGLAAAAGLLALLVLTVSRLVARRTIDERPLRNLGL